MKKKIDIAKVLYYIVLVTLILSIVYVSIRIYDAPVSGDDVGIRTKSSYA